MSKFLFKCSSDVVDLEAYLPESRDLEFRFDRPRPVLVRLSRNSWDGPSAVGVRGMCTADAVVEIVDEEMVSDLRRALSTSPDDRWANLKEINRRTLEFLQGLLDEMYGLTISTVAVFRWRFGVAEGPPQPHRNSRGHYSEDGQLWREVSMLRRLQISFGLPRGPIPAPEVIADEVVELVQTGADEPLGRQLFREAWSQRKSRPRSALVIGVAAAEVGFKKLVGALVPPAQWLVDEVQTPSLEKMLTKFLPTLPVKARFHGKSIRPPKALLKKLQKAVEYRNKLVHAGQAPPNRAELDAMLLAVSDFLWICDVYLGRGWASEYISTAGRLDWPDEAASKPAEVGSI